MKTKYEIPVAMAAPIAPKKELILKFKNELLKNKKITKNRTVSKEALFVQKLKTHKIATC